MRYIYIQNDFNSFFTMLDKMHKILLKKKFPEIFIFQISTSLKIVTTLFLHLYTKNKTLHNIIIVGIFFSNREKLKIVQCNKDLLCRLFGSTIVKYFHHWGTGKVAQAHDEGNSDKNEQITYFRSTPFPSLRPPSLHGQKIYQGSQAVKLQTIKSSFNSVILYAVYMES